MVRTLALEPFLSEDRPVIDVRSPGEHLQGHIPGAYNLPLFSDAERAVVGTLYKQSGRDAAVLKGLHIVGPKLAGLVEHARTLAPEGRVAVHCWRGGERSASVAWLLDKAGGFDVVVLQRGYKAFRRAVRDAFAEPLPLIVLGGFTGTGKTELLQVLQRMGEQVIDLEALAHHRGSSFGALGLPPQPTTEHFENLLWKTLRTLDRSRPVWIEDESALIGSVKVPDALFLRLRSAPLLFVEMSQAVRAQRLVKDYGNADRQLLREAIMRIERRLGPQHAKAALQALDAGDLAAVATISLLYYDKTYARGASLRPPSLVHRLPVDRDDVHATATQLRTYAHERLRDHLSRTAHPA
jgi:tRNA 2-selenouridine synthase